MLTYFSSDFCQDVELSVLSGELLVGHVSCRSSRTDVVLTLIVLEQNVLDIGMNPAVGLAVHRLGSQSGRYQKDWLVLKLSIVINIFC